MLPCLSRPLNSALLTLNRLRSALALAFLGVLATPAPAQLAATLRARLGVDELSVVRLVPPVGLPATFEVTFEHGGERFVLDLRKRSVRSRSFAVAVVGADGVYREVDPPEVRTWRGTVRGRPELRVAAAVEDGHVFATIAAEDGVRLVVQPVAPLVADAPAGLSVVHVPARLPVDACGVFDHSAATVPAGGPLGAFGGGLPLAAEIAFDCDVEFFQFKGSSVAAVVADIERTLDAVNVVYERDVGITHRISRIIVRTAEPDPYSGNDAGTILGTQFRGEWNSNQASVPRDLAHFVTSRSMGNILGLAYVGVVCNRGSAYALSRFGSNFDQNASVLCHEMGHNWSAPHCLDPCDVMCGCGIAGGFGPNDRAQIISFRDSRSCLRKLHPELVAHYRLDERTGTVAQDSGPNGLPGVFVGGTALARPGARTGTDVSAGFDGVDDAVRIPDGPGLSGLVGGFSVALWVRPAGAGGQGGQRFFSNGPSWAFGTWFGQLSLTQRGLRDYRSSATLPVGAWSHVAVTADGDTGVAFYVDGQRVDTAGAWTAPRPTGSEWHVGSRDGSYEFFAGDIDDVQVYDGILSDAQVAFLHANPGTPLCQPGWESYGAGLAGTLRTPTLAVVGLPIVGRGIDLQVHSASPFIVPAVGILGTAPASTPAFGGTILVDLSTAMTFIQPVGPLVPVSVRVPIPNDPALSCTSFYAQFAHADPGAVQGLALTPGVRIVVGG